MLTPAKAVDSMPDKYYRTNLPSQFHGDWCEAPGSKPTVAQLKKCKEGSTTINAKGFSTEDQDCQAVKVMLPELNPKHIWVKFLCQDIGAGESRMISWDMRRDGDKIIIRDVNKERLMSGGLADLTGPYEPMRSWTAAADWASQLHGERSTNIERRDLQPETQPQK
jgi:hypothetical protein